MLSAMTAVLAGLALVLDYQRAKLEAEARARAARLHARLKRDRLAVYRDLLERAADATGSAVAFRDLILADARHLAAEQSGIRAHGSRTRSNEVIPAQGEVPEN
jgi:hypothetical protein